MRTAMRTALALTVMALATTARAAELPQYVKGPVSGLVYDCRQARQKAPKPETYVTAGDLDGDGQPDHVVDVQKGCQANRDLYCNAEGCTIDVYLSSQSGQAGSFRAKSFRIDTSSSKPALVVAARGKDCPASQAEGCSVAYVFDGKAFVVRP